eukprot:m.183306 g.183306  ORF g.183306 m.183306 type:complete len:134 (+) comp15783_c0_seq1:430-831(+)
MNALERFVTMATGYSGRADFITVYLEEAHPTDGWYIPNVHHRVEQHTTLSERITMATVLEQRLGELVGTTTESNVSIPMYVDTMTNEASLLFGALPERLAIVLNGRLVFLGGPGPEEYSLDKAFAALDTMMPN